jgi:NTP pyrophosphatase (non-canonical NTP hydrolase)
MGTNEPRSPGDDTLHDPRLPASGIRDTIPRGDVKRKRGRVWGCFGIALDSEAVAHYSPGNESFLNEGSDVADSTTTLAELRQLMAQFVDERDWRQFHAPKNLAMALACESAELMEHFLWMENAESHEHMKDALRLAPVADELADVLGVCLALANALDLDLSDAFRAKMQRNHLKYPAERARGRYRLED